MYVTFQGAARQVTGSCFLFETTRTRFLVDCGMFQGPTDTRARNTIPFASRIKAELGWDACIPGDGERVAL